MANMYGAANHSSSSSPDEPDDFSLFLHQIMLRSPSSSSSSFMVQKNKERECFRPTCAPPGNQDCVQSLLVSGSDRIPKPEASSGGGLQWSSGVVFTSPGTCFQESGVLVSSSSVSIATVDDDLNEYDCESEGFEGVVDEAMMKQTAARNSSKRSRAAEVHNLSEKRRRSRINEKMKALQNLIPNSNKTDKASMLDEAIDYLKQLQLQVQLLTMRNGLSLYPMCLPGVVQSNQLSEMRTGYEGKKSLNMSLTSALSVNPAASTNVLLSLPENYSNHDQASIVNLSKINDLEHSLAPESAILADHGAFQFPLPGSSNKGIYMEEKLPCQQSNRDLSGTKSVEEYMGAEATASFTFNAQTSCLEENTLEACVLGRDKSRALLTNLEYKKFPLSQGDGVQSGSRSSIER